MYTIGTSLGFESDVHVFLARAGYQSSRATLLERHHHSSFACKHCKDANIDYKCRILAPEERCPRYTRILLVYHLYV